MRQLQLKNRTFQVESLPSETALLVELVSHCHDDIVSFEALSGSICKDPGLTTKILEMSNSPAFRQWNDVHDVRQILIVLGMSNVKQIVIAHAIKQFFSCFSHEFNAHVQGVWFRALICSNLTKNIAKFIGHDKLEEACLAGLLHQVGQLLFLLNHQRDYPEVLLQYYKTDNFCQLEQDAFGLDHCELGAALLENWKMDSLLIDAVRFQHAPVSEMQEAPLLLKILSVASSLSSENGHSPSNSGLSRAGQLFNMTEDSTQNCFNEALEQTREMVEALGYDWDGLLTQHIGEQSPDREKLQQAERKLAEQVKAIALTRGSLTPEIKDINSLLSELRIGFRALFNLEALIFLQADPQNKRLCPVKDINLNFPHEINLLYQDSSSLIAKSFRNHYSQKLQLDSSAIVDKQLIRLLKVEQAYAFPVQSGNEVSGVLLLGLKTEDTDFVDKNLFFIELLISEFAQIHQGIMAVQNQVPGFTFEEFRQISHEVTNPLSIIKNYLFLLGQKLEKESVALEQISFINEEIERAGDILLRAKNGQMTVSKKGSRALDVNAVITNLDDVLCNSLYKIAKIKSHLQLDPNIPLLQGSTDQLKQILINLIKNAVEAMENGGQIKITTRDHFYRNGQGYVEITLQDSGPGIPEQVLQHLFKPVVSTKKGHSGLGLSIVRNLISDLGGDISCCSASQTGTEFKILLLRILAPTGGS